MGGITNRGNWEGAIQQASLPNAEASIRLIAPFISRTAATALSSPHFVFVTRIILLCRWAITHGLAWSITSTSCLVLSSSLSNNNHFYICFYTLIRPTAFDQASPIPTNTTHSNDIDPVSLSYTQSPPAPPLRPACIMPLLPDILGDVTQLYK
ncbi:hypothetical protein NXS19_009836 [Fusarium pseudograminearum]|nr:hypothetical protein NXS19_009836 [Fusarium pseudograminearum]